MIMDEIISKILYIGSNAKATAAKGLILAEHIEEYIMRHPVLIWGPIIFAIAVLIGVALYKGRKRLSKIRNTIIATTLLTATLAGTLPGMNAYFTDQETASRNTIQTATILFHYSTGGHNNAVAYGGPHQNRSLVWIKNDETDKTLVIESISLIHPTFQQSWIEKIWASPQHSQTSEGKPRNATIGPGEKRWIWMRIDHSSATHGQYDNPTVRLTVNGSTIDIDFNKINVN